MPPLFGTEPARKGCREKARHVEINALLPATSLLYLSSSPLPPKVLSAQQEQLQLLEKSIGNVRYRGSEVVRTYFNNTIKWLGLNGVLFAGLDARVRR